MTDFVSRTKRNCADVKRRKQREKLCGKL